MAENNEVKVIRPPDTLKVKVGTGGPGAVDMAALERAEKVIEEMTGDYLDWVAEDLKSLQQAMGKVVPGSDDIKETLNGVFQIAHDMKGQGGSFGYDLITVVGDKLCRVLERLEGDASPGDVEVMRLHVDTMKVIITNDMKGDGGEEGAKLLKGLDMVADKVVK